MAQQEDFRGSITNIHMSYIVKEAASLGDLATVVFCYKAVRIAIELFFSRIVNDVETNTCFNKVEGPSQGSYGLNVARMARMSPAILALAKDKSDWMLRHCSLSLNEKVSEGGVSLLLDSPQELLLWMRRQCDKKKSSFYSPANKKQRCETNFMDKNEMFSTALEAAAYFFTSKFVS